MAYKQLQFHTWVKDSNQSDTGKLGVRIRCIRSYHESEVLIILPQQLKDYGMPMFQYVSVEELKP